MQLNQLVERYVPRSLRQVRDFIGDEGWAYLANILIRRLEREGLIRETLVKENPVFIENTWFPNQIVLPSDFRKYLDLWEFNSSDPTDKREKYHADMINGRLVVVEEYDDTAMVDTTTRNIVAPGATTTEAKISPYGTGDDIWKNYAVFFQSGAWDDGAGTYYPQLLAVTDCRLIYASLDTSESLYWQNPFATAPQTNDYVYIFGNFLMLQYEATYAVLSAHDDEIPLDDDYEEIIGLGLRYMGADRSDKRFPTFKREYEEAIATAGVDVFTPSEEEGRPGGREVPDFDAEPDGDSTHHLADEDVT